MPLRVIVMALAAGSVLLAGLLPAELVRDRCGIRFTSFLLAERGGPRVSHVTWPSPAATEAERSDLYPRSSATAGRQWATEKTRGQSCVPGSSGEALEIPVEGLYALGLLCLWTLSSARMRNPGFGAMQDGLRIGLAVPLIELSVGGSGFWGGSALLLFLGAATLWMAGRIVWFLADPGARPRTIDLRIDRREVSV